MKQEVEVLSSTFHMAGDIMEVSFLKSLEKRRDIAVRRRDIARMTGKQELADQLQMKVVLCEENLASARKEHLQELDAVYVEWRKHHRRE